LLPHWRDSMRRPDLGRHVGSRGPQAAKPGRGGGRSRGRTDWGARPAAGVQVHREAPAAAWITRWPRPAGRPWPWSRRPRAWPAVGQVS